MGDAMRFSSRRTGHLHRRTRANRSANGASPPWDSKLSRKTPANSIWSFAAVAMEEWVRQLQRREWVAKWRSFRTGQSLVAMDRVKCECGRWVEFGGDCIQ